MSNSRLEKFIYAICGMEVDNLPTPLSRIETLWNCLITGETPDFEPLSRNEKYLMSMLTGDVDALPEPTSRSEKLLYKIATGETDLSDVSGYLSRYEELLKCLIENGGFGGTDFEYVLYTLNDSFSTLYSTAEAPVRSAILSGNTLVNLSENLTTITRSVNGWYIDEKLMNNIEKLKHNTYYTILYRLENLSGNHERYNGIGLGIGLTGFNKDLPGVTSILDKNGGWCKIKFQLTDELIEQNPTYKQLYIRPIRRFNAPVEGESVNYTIRGFVILEGDYITKPIPFNEVFESMQSVKLPVLTTTGKNLFDGNLINGYYEDGTLNKIIGGNENIYKTIKLNLKKGTYTFSFEESVRFIRQVKDGVYEVLGGDFTKFTTTLNTDGIYVLSFRKTDNTDFDLTHIQVEQGSIATPYEPYKSNILTATSKNLFDMNRPYDNLTDSQATVVQDTNQITVSSSAESGIYVNANFILDKDFFAGKTVTGSCLYESDENDIGTVQITYQDGDGEYHYQWIKTPRTFTFPNSFIGDVMLSISANNTGTPQSNTVTVKNIQLELGSTATPYEPYSEVMLRGIGDVKDTLDGNTGELTQRIGEIVLDGSENWVAEDTRFRLFRNDIIPNKWSNGISNYFIGNRGQLMSGADYDNYFAINGYGLCLYVRDINLFPNPKSQLNEFKSWLSERNAQGNPVILQYYLSQEVIKTVDLSITDQDGQPTKLKTFNDVTHVSIEAEDLLPTVDLEVPTKIEETLSTLPTLMNDISETQQSLNECIDDQAENINEVSTAMTEIHNDIL